VSVPKRLFFAFSASITPKADKSAESPVRRSHVPFHAIQ
jgi:hypothetical protein